MIDVRIFENPRRGNLGMVVKGHAGAGVKGEDLVCAGMSTLACTAAMAAKMMYASGWLTRPPRIRLENGVGQILVTPRKDKRDAVRMSFWTIQVGAFYLAQSCPEYVRLEVMKVVA